MQSVFFFGNGKADGTRDMKTVLGGKGANLAEMTRIGVPVPPGFTLNTDSCRFYLREVRFPPGLEEQVADALTRLERDSGKRFGGLDNPLLVSVRSGAAVSMPGMMDTILNLGLNDDTVEALARVASDARFAYDSYRRFVQMYGEVVMGVPGSHFEERLEAAKLARGVEEDTALSPEDLQQLVADFKTIVGKHTGEDFPEDPQVQLWGAIEAVYRSWNVERAVAYRRVHGIPDYLGTAVNVVAMVYGNLGDDSGTGVAFTRNPSTGERKFFGEFLVNAQGEDVVAGIRTPLSIDQMASRLPQAYEQLLEVQRTLEQHYREMQDLEFTVEKGRLYLLQTRTGKRTAAAALRIAVEMVDEGLISEQEAVLRVDPKQLDQLLHPRIDPDAPVTVFATGLPASPGAATGIAVFDPGRAAERAAAGDRVILIRNETSPDDFHGMVAAEAVVTARGGMTSHAAVVARGMGKCCVVGATALQIRDGVCRARERQVEEGDWVTVDGTSGRVLLGKVPTIDPEPDENFRKLMIWADGYRRLRVRTNADTPHDAEVARSFGAEGIGLCRTEHMFFDGDRIVAVREMIMADQVEGRKKALAKILPMQRQDFIELFKIMRGLPVTIRLLDPPLHEFLPHSREEMAEVAKAAGVTPDAVAARTAQLHETNPMLGHRGCRLGITYPEIYEMQARAIFEAAAAVHKEIGETVEAEIMIPLVGIPRELTLMKAVVERVAREVEKASGFKLPYMIGTMIELPRACLLAGEIAKEAEFFSYGTNDLTQTTYGISRDDAASFVTIYERQGIIKKDPFISLDVDGVGELVQIATERGRKARPKLKLGICGEHGGDPASIHFCAKVGLDYVSCSPYRVPIAKLAAAQAALSGTDGRKGEG